METNPKEFKGTVSAFMTKFVYVCLTVFVLFLYVCLFVCFCFCFVLFVCVFVCLLFYINSHPNHT